MTDKSLMKGRFAKAAGTYSDNASVQRETAEKMCSLLSGLFRCRRFGKILEIGCGTGILSRLLMSEFKPDILYLNDICEEYGNMLDDMTENGATFLPGDAETIGLPSGMNMIASCSVFQWFDDLPAFVVKAADSLSSGGIFAFSAFGGMNLREISELTGNRLHYHSLAEFEEMLGGRFAVLRSEEVVRTLHFSSAVSVLKHLKATGVTGIKQEFWTRRDLENFEARYREKFMTGEGLLTLTYHPIIIIAEKII